MPDRTVASMAPVQLYRKRALDRENQRLSRLRKRGRIEDLEAEVDDLKRRLRSAENKAEQLRKSNATLQEAMQSALSTLQTAISTRQRECSPTILSPVSAIAVQENLETAEDLEFSDLGSTATLPEASSQDQQESPTPVFQLQNDLENVEIAPQISGLSFSLPLDNWFEMSNPLAEHSQDANCTTANTFSLTFLDSMDPALYSLLDDGSQFVDQASGSDTESIPIWKRLPTHTPPNSRIETVMLELTNSGRQYIEKNGQIEELSEPTFPSVASLLNPEAKDSRNPISSAIGIHGKVTMTRPGPAERVSMMYLMCNYVRWLVSPSKRTYEAMPVFLRPTEAQLTIPHPIWVDILAWPGARDAVIHEMDWSQFETLRSVTTRGYSVNWPYQVSDICTSISGNELGLNPVFEVHIRNLENYTYSSSVSQVFPFLAPFVAPQGPIT